RTKDECHLLGTDLQQSILHLVSADEHHVMAYNAYGHRPVENGLISVLGFNGERADPVTGHYLLGNGYRAFNPVLMRFNSPDSMSPFGKGGVNSYAYCKGNPVLRTDPTGHFLIALVTATARRLGRSLGRFVERHGENYLRVAPRIIQGIGASLIGMAQITRGREATLTLSFGTAFVAIGGAAEYSIARLTRQLDEVLQSRVAQLEDLLVSSHRAARANHDDLTQAYETIDAQQRQITQLQARVTGAPPPYTATRHPPGPPPPYTPGIATRIRRSSI
ncbi:RHS repeat-associated core domain-containing protein, partial [Pseudomonas lundensis]